MKLLAEALLFLLQRWYEENCYTSGWSSYCSDLITKLTEIK